jgi:hypothetical protein
MAIDDTTGCRHALPVLLGKPSNPFSAGYAQLSGIVRRALGTTRAAALTLTNTISPSSALCLLQGLKRASLVSSVLLLNYLYFEGKRKRHNRGGGGGGGFASN